MSITWAAPAAVLAAAPGRAPEAGRLIIEYVFVQDRLLDPASGLRRAPATR